MPHDDDEKVKEEFTTNAAIFVRLKELFHTIEGGGSAGGASGGHPPVPVVDGSSGAFVAHATWNPSTGHYEYIDPGTTVVVEVSSGSSSASFGGGFSGLGTSDGESSSTDVGSSGGGTSTRIPKSPPVVDPAHVDPYHSGYVGQPLPEIVQVDNEHEYLSLPCPGGIHRTAKLPLQHLIDAENMSKSAVIWIGGVDAAGNIMPAGRIMLEPGQSLSHYDRPAGAIGIAISCGGGTNSGTAHFRHNIGIPA